MSKKTSATKKPARKIIAKAINPNPVKSQPVGKIKTMTLYTTAPKNGGKYEVLPDNSVRGGLTIAALIALNVVSFISGTSKQLKSTGKALDRSAFRMLVGKTAGNTVPAKVCGKDNKVSATGINFLQARLNGQTGYATTPEIVRAIYNVMTSKNGGTAKIDGKTIKVDSPVTFTVK